VSREKILNAALTHFAAHGYSETSLKDIAASAGIKAPSIYAHFENKESLFLEVYRASVEDHQEFFSQQIASSQSLSPLEQLHVLLYSVRDFYEARPELVDFHLRSAVSSVPSSAEEAKPVFEAEDSDMRAAVRTAYCAGVDSGEFIAIPAESFCALFVAILDGLFLELNYYDSQLYKQRLDAAWEALRALIAPPQARAAISSKPAR
jgi:TetR/AcrR family transcriptional repressor of cmeABC operon